MTHVTIREVAAAAEVSPATASRVLSGTNLSGPIRDETRARVLEAASRLQYVNPKANAPKSSRRGRTIGLLLPEMTNPYFAELAQALADGLHFLGHQAIIAVTEDKHKNHDHDQFEYESVKALLRRGVDAIIAVPASTMSERAWETVLASRTRLICIDRELGGRFSDLDSVTINNREGAKTATSYLLAAGHKHIGYLTGPLSVSTLTERLRGYENAFEDLRRPVEKEYIQPCTFAVGSRLNAARKLLAVTPHPTAIFAPSNLLCESVLVAVRERKLSIPKDVSLIMFDDVHWATVTSPRMTTVSNPAKKLARAAIDLLQRKLFEDMTQPEHIQLQVAELVVRESTLASETRPAEPAATDDPAPEHPIIATPAAAFNANHSSV